MRRVPFGLAAAGLAFWLGTAVSQRPEVARTGPFGPLREGDKVTLRDKGGRYEVTLLPQPDAGSHRVVELGKDFVCVEDIAGISKSWIPLTSVHAVTRYQVGR